MNEVFINLIIMSLLRVVSCSPQYLMVLKLQCTKMPNIMETGNTEMFITYMECYK